MKPDWNRRFAAGLLAILLCLCSFSMPAFASGSDPAPESLPEILDEKTTTGGMEPEGVPITPKGNATLLLGRGVSMLNKTMKKIRHLLNKGLCIIVTAMLHAIVY